MCSWGEGHTNKQTNINKNKKNKKKLLYVDTEGFESTGRANSYDDRVFAVAAVLSSLLVYNLPETIRGSDVAKLSFAVDLAQGFYDTYQVCGCCCFAVLVGVCFGVAVLLTKKNKTKQNLGQRQQRRRVVVIVIITSVITNNSAGRRAGRRPGVDAVAHPARLSRRRVGAGACCCCCLCVFLCCVCVFRCPPLLIITLTTHPTLNNTKKSTKKQHKLKSLVDEALAPVPNPGGADKELASLNRVRASLSAIAGNSTGEGEREGFFWFWLVGWLVGWWVVCAFVCVQEERGPAGRRQTAAAAPNLYARETRRRVCQRRAAPATVSAPRRISD